MPPRSRAAGPEPSGPRRARTVWTAKGANRLDREGRERQRTPRSRTSGGYAASAIVHARWRSEARSSLQNQLSVRSISRQAAVCSISCQSLGSSGLATANCKLQTANCELTSDPG